MTKLDDILAQLRHAYMQLNAGRVKDQKQFANGLLAPQIRELEKMARAMADVASFTNGDGQ